MSERCPTSNELFAAATLMAVLGACIAGAVGHGVLRPLLEARGVSPWRVRDSLGSLPLVLIGGALLSGAVAWLSMQLVMPCVFGWPLVAGVVIVVCAAVMMMRLGIHALRKLS